MKLSKDWSLFLAIGLPTITMLAILFWCSVGYGETVITEGLMKSYTTEEAIKEINKETTKRDIAILKDVKSNFELIFILTKELSELKADLALFKQAFIFPLQEEVEELRKIIKLDKKEITILMNLKDCGCSRKSELP